MIYYLFCTRFWMIKWNLYKILTAIVNYFFFTVLLESIIKRRLVLVWNFWTQSVCCVSIHRRFFFARHSKQRSTKVHPKSSQALLKLTRWHLEPNISIILTKYTIIIYTRCINQQWLGAMSRTEWNDYWFSIWST